MNIEEELQDIMIHSPILEYIVIKRSLAKDVINELDKKEKAIEYIEETFELEEDKNITELYNILK